MSIRVAATDRDLRRVFPVIQELRRHLDEDTFVAMAQRQASHGYRIAFLTANGKVKAAAGIRIAESLAWGKYLYVDDLVATETSRSEGHGAALLEWIESVAATEGCSHVHLDSGTQRTRAHAFYERSGYTVAANHFVKSVCA